jgi:hypothetical protein
VQLQPRHITDLMAVPSQAGHKCSFDSQHDACWSWWLHCAGCACVRHVGRVCYSGVPSNVKPTRMD